MGKAGPEKYPAMGICQFLTVLHLCATELIAYQLMSAFAEARYLVHNLSQTFNTVVPPVSTGGFCFGEIVGKRVVANYPLRSLLHSVRRVGMRTIKKRSGCGPDLFKRYVSC